MSEILQTIQDIMRRVPVLRQEQLEQYLYQHLDCHTSKTRDTLVSAGKVGRLLISKNGFVTTKEYLPMLQDWEEEPRLNEFSYCRLESLAPKRKFLDEIDCFWAVIDMHRNSEDFFVASAPFQIQFIRTSGDRFVQILRMRAEDELTLPLQLRSMPWPEEGWRDRIQRVAIVDSAAAASLVPHTGFTHICVLDPAEKNHLRLVQKREGDAVWIPEQSLG